MCACACTCVHLCVLCVCVGGGGQIRTPKLRPLLFWTLSSSGACAAAVVEKSPAPSVYLQPSSLGLYFWFPARLSVL